MITSHMSLQKILGTQMCLQNIQAEPMCILDTGSEARQPLVVWRSLLSYFILPISFIAICNILCDFWSLCICDLS